MRADLLLGIDVGTTKIAAVVADRQGGVAAAVSQKHAADLPAAPGRAEQDATVLLGKTWDVVRSLPADLRQCVQGVGVTGQMHGVVLLDARNDPVTPLITWQDRRCLEADAFLERLREATGYRMHTGYGLATLAWLHRHRQHPDRAVAASTAQDLVVAHLCRLPRPITDPSNAASWGCFDLHASGWDAAAVDATGIDARMLPAIHPFGHVAGLLDPAVAGALGLPEGVPVHVAVGDLPAALLATLEDPEQDLALNLGTGGQAAVVTSGKVAMQAGLADAWPYPGDRVAVVAASLCGGAAWAWLVDGVHSWLRDLGMPLPAREALFDRVNALGMAADHEIPVRPHFLGERHDPALRGAIGGLTLSDFSLGALARGLARSIVSNLYTMLPPEVLQHRTRLIGSGNALRRTPLLQQMAEEVFGLPLTLASDVEEAATGAALLAAGKR